MFQIVRQRRGGQKPANRGEARALILQAFSKAVAALAENFSFRPTMMILQSKVASGVTFVSAESSRRSGQFWCVPE